MHLKYPIYTPNGSHTSQKKSFKSRQPKRQKRQMRPGADAPRWRKKIFELYLSGDWRKGGHCVGEIYFFLAVPYVNP